MTFFAVFLAVCFIFPSIIFACQCDKKASQFQCERFHMFVRGTPISTRKVPNDRGYRRVVKFKISHIFFSAFKHTQNYIWIIETDGCSSHLYTGGDYALALFPKKENNHYYFKSSICSPSTRWKSLSKKDILIWEKCGKERTSKEPAIAVIDADLYPEADIFRKAKIPETLVLGIKLSTIILFFPGLLVACIIINKNRWLWNVLISCTESKMRKIRSSFLTVRENLQGMS
jgi:hypothetical protein